MNTTTLTDEVNQINQELPGSQLARIREKKGFSQEYVAGKLHLRVRVIELLEADNYEQMPEPVFIKGYLRAYAKLLGISPEPFLSTYNSLFNSERKLEKALWQSRRESNRKEKVVRWITMIVALAAVISVSLWWQKNKTNQTVISTEKVSEEKPMAVNTEADTKLTELSQMQSMFSNDSDSSASEVQGG
ncbi:DNA-binding protein [Legionella quinlivanii]|uniref:DNA-binding protein n=1 Tax=Legionella quinlivanii TaxID=45073 RepID=A0A0W0XTL0_9GAMM|nr:helix-turn-helix domain-containing protein [Legionella quinlivanii]KTD47948.1 DNA-binding protein [Legionella quinlivanii]MCW8450772.1 helix-turn-helix domain-containing protein [Legionella quinlivanii]SEG19796.1 cytoskeleton protein RodZ [Legionella quinlivanii DSM 21216]STY11058.1 DNA-binding protein [Legionella quinlivanii]